MAIVPMPKGPSVSPTIPEGGNFSILTPEKDRAGEKAANDLAHAAGGLNKAVADAYDRMSAAVADEAMNNIEADVGTLMTGENGALRQIGSEVVKRKGTDYQTYYGREIDRIIESRTQELDTYQKKLIRSRVQDYRQGRLSELRNHAIKQAEVYETAVAKTKGESASEAIAVDPMNIKSVEENAKRYEEAYRTINRGSPEESMQDGIRDGISKSIRNGIEALLANDNPEAAEGVLRHYRGNRLTATDVLEVQPKIRTALQKKAENVTTKQVVASTVGALTKEKIMASTFPKSDGQPFDKDRFDRAVVTVSEIGKPEWAEYVYLVGEKAANEILKKWQDDIAKAKEEGDTKKEEAIRNYDPFESALTRQQRAALQDYQNQASGIYSGDKEVIRRQILDANPDASPAIVDKAVKEIADSRRHALELEKARRNQDAANVMALLSSGTAYDAIAPESLSLLTERQKEGLKDYAERIKTGSFVTNSSLYYNLRYNNEELKNLEWADLYGLANQFRPQDFDTLVNRKLKLESGIKEDDKSKFVQDSVKDALARVGFTRPSDKGRQAIYDRMSRILIDSVTDRMTTDFGKGWDDEKVRKTVNELCSKKFRVTGWLWDSNYNVGEFLNSSSFSNKGDVNDMIDAALVSTGYSEPRDLDRSEFLISYILNPDKPLPGEAAFVDAAKPSEVKAIREAFKARNNGQEPTTHFIAGALINARFLQ